MAKFVMKTTSVVLNSVDFSDHIDTVTVETSYDEVESTSFQDAFKTFEQGMGDATLTFGFQQDFAAGEVDATLWPLALAGTTFPVVVKPTSSAVGATNPTYTMTGRLFAYSPLDGSVGDLSKTTVTVRNASSTGLVRATS
jgi:hypothetical protein